MNPVSFEDLYSRLNKIIDLVDRVPTNLREDVFQTLFNAAKENSPSNMYINEILKLSESAQPIKAYIIEKQPASNIERSLFFVYYLETLGLEEITAKHIEACYTLCKLKEPGNLIQNLRDACSARYGYLESVQNHFQTTGKGKDFCHKEL